MSKQLKNKIIALLFTLALVFAAAFGLSYGNTKKAYALAPINAQVNGTVVSWEAVEGAYDYWFWLGKRGRFLDGATSVDLEEMAKLFRLETGTYAFAITAYNENREKISEAFEGEYDYVNTQIPLDAPTNIRWDHATAVWDEVEDAGHYEVHFYKYVDGVNDEYIDYYSVGDRYFKYDDLEADANISYYFMVKSCPLVSDLDHTYSAFSAKSDVKSFTQEDLDYEYQEPVPEPDPELPQLNAQVNGTVVSWEAVEGAYDYWVAYGNSGGYLNGKTSFDLEEKAKYYHQDSGILIFTVYAVNADKERISKKFVYEYEYVSTQVPLEKPTNLRWDHSTAMWDEVEDAYNYWVLIYKYVDGTNDERVNYCYSYNNFYKYGGLQTDTSYYFEVQACAGRDDLDHKDSEYSISDNATFTQDDLDYEYVVYTVTYNRNGGLGNDYVVKNLEGGEYTILPLAETGISANDGDFYHEHFVGWSYESDGEIITTPTIEITADTELYAIWQENTELTGTVEIVGTLKYGETLTANVSDTNNTGDLFYEWWWLYISDEGYEWRKIGTFTVNTYTITQNEVVGHRIQVAVGSSVESGSFYAESEIEVAEADPVAPKGISAGAIIGIVLGGVVVLGCGGFAIYWFVIKKKSWAEFVALLKKAWADCVSFFKNAWAKFIGLFKKK